MGSLKRIYPCSGIRRDILDCNGNISLIIRTNENQIHLPCE